MSCYYCCCLFRSRSKAGVTSLPHRAEVCLLWKFSSSLNVLGSTLFRGTMQMYMQIQHTQAATTNIENNVWYIIDAIYLLCMVFNRLFHPPVVHFIHNLISSVCDTSVDLRACADTQEVFQRQTGTIKQEHSCWYRDIKKSVLIWLKIIIFWISLFVWKSE